MIDKFDTLTSSGEWITIDPNRDLAINAGSLTEEMVCQPGKYAYYASLLAVARSQRKALELKLDRLKAPMYAGAVKEMRKWHLEARLLVEVPDSDNLIREMAKWDERIDKLSAVVVGLEQRMEMLRSIGTNHRNGFRNEAELRVKERITLIKRGGRDGKVD